MCVRHVTLHYIRLILVSAMALVVSGCSIVQPKSFTFQAELPEHFNISAVTYYESASNEACSSHKIINGGQPEGTRLAELTLPLTDGAKGCSMVLKRVALHIEGKWGRRDQDMDMDFAGLSIRDAPSQNVRTFPNTGPLVFQGQCQWLFRTMGSRRYIVKILQCRALDANGVVQKSLPGAALQRDQLAGKTVKMVLTVAKEELPAVGDSWIKFPSGWKRCIGKGPDDFYGFCRGNTKDFIPFKMPDGSNCTVYPNCTE
ncbi:hypothetical protein AO391_12190 [Pseudomonas marginalis ICMP 9505]|nr:hypothetical protein AO391_12190 [Pseudomonas marginalis ICMP 9505]